MGPSGTVHYEAAVRIEAHAKKLAGGLAALGLVPSWEGSAAFTGLSLAALALGKFARNNVLLYEEEARLRQEIIDQIQVVSATLGDPEPGAATALQPEKHGHKAQAPSRVERPVRRHPRNQPPNPERAEEPETNDQPTT